MDWYSSDGEESNSMWPLSDGSLKGHVSLKLHYSPNKRM